MFSEVVLSCSSTDSTSYLWDIRSGTVVFSLKQNLVPKNGVARAPVPWAPARTGLVLSAQTDKAIINSYSWKKDQVHAKSLCPEKIITVAVSHNGVYCAGGTQAGKIYLWEVCLTDRAWYCNNNACINEVVGRLQRACCIDPLMRTISGFRLYDLQMTIRRWCLRATMLVSMSGC